ncbi:DUF1684 domain-containing protein [Deinococcus fonticola]|uniref:DUF1684 domain-containing protein n=1 Tax=Deinococcus fonticola TaxID=2528713 RepID=UPI0010751191|nr:DUF1684 domain-containing protein [Deinococcus fonticola]
MTGSAALLEHRRRKDEYFRSGRGPLRGAALAHFTGLAYYPEAPEWRLSLELHPAVQPTGGVAEFTLETNSGETRFMELIGTVGLPLPGGGTHALQVFGPLGDDSRRSVFLPFRDLTSGPETYGAGRYVDAPLRRDETTGQAKVMLDFNLAYHPYCAYGDGWTCPLPPLHNRLPVAVRAGERLPF